MLFRCILIVDPLKCFPHISQSYISWHVILELSKALENERRVNEDLRNALDNDYEETDKADDTQRNVVKELQISLTAVQVTMHCFYLINHDFKGKEYTLGLARNS